MERTTIVCYLGGIWRRLEQLERIYGSCPSVDQLSRFAGVPNLGKPLYGGGGVRVCGDAVLLDFGCDFAEILILICSTVFLQNLAVCGI